MDVDIVAESFLDASPAVAADRLRQERLLREWFPELTLTVFMDRAEKGTRWSMSGALNGSMEVWLEQWGSGAIVHWYVRGEHSEPPPGPRARRRQLGLADELRVRIARRMHAFKDQIETGASTDRTSASDPRSPGA